MLSPQLYAMPERGLKDWIPVMGSPTVSFIRVADGWRQADRSWVHRHMLSRAACCTATACAALDSLARAIAGVTTVLGITCRVVIRTSFRLAATLVGGSWGLIYGGAITFSMTVWIRRIVINVVLFGRSMAIAAEHWMERAVLARDHLYLGACLWAYALRTDRVLRQYFNGTIAQHHFVQSFNFGKFLLSNSFVGVVSPEYSIYYCQDFELGKPLPPPPLTRQVYHFVWKHWTKIAMLGLCVAAANDYYQNGHSDPQTWAFDWGYHIVNEGSSKLRNFFTLVGEVPYDIAILAKTAASWAEESIKHMQWERNMREQQCFSPDFQQTCSL